MFNGTQKNLFWKKMKQILGEKDLFLISISYICEEKEKNRWKQAMYAYPFEGAEEILFAMSILPDDETLWEGIKQKLADSFSKNRKISVFTEWNLFVWMVGKVMTRLKGYEYLQGNEKCSNSPEPDRKERGRFLYECGQTGKSAGTFQSDGGVK